MSTQENVRSGKLSITKVEGEDNLADGLTEHIDRCNLEKYVKECGFVFRYGRQEECRHIGIRQASLVQCVFAFPVLQSRHTHIL